MTGEAVVMLSTMAPFIKPSTPPFETLKKKHPYHAVVRMDNFDTMMIKKFIGTGGTNIRLLEHATGCTLSVRDLSDPRNKIGCVHVLIYAETIESLDFGKRTITDHLTKQFFNNQCSTQQQQQQQQQSVRQFVVAQPFVQVPTYDESQEANEVLMTEMRDLKRRLEWLENKLMDQDFTISCLLENRGF
jgi:hypothetical protein